MNDLFLGKGAEEDYADSYQWYYQRSPDIAARFEKEVIKSLEIIRADPGRFPHVDKKHRFYLLRRFPFQLIFREIESNRTMVVAVVHTSRRPGYWKGRSK